MMDISFNKDVLQNLEKSQQIEWLERNKLGLYSSSTCIGMNTRREHGFFAVPDHVQQKNIVLVSKFEESVFLENRLYEISTNSYKGGIFPSGFSYINNFSINPFPKTIFQIEGRIIEKTLFLLSDRPILVVRYEIKNKGEALNLIIKPFIADRFSTEVSKELQGLNTDSYQGSQFVRWALKQNMPEVYVHYSAGEFESANLWYKNFTYPNDIGKYGDSLEEHLFNPGFFKVILNPHQSVDLYISTENLDLGSLNYESLYRSESELRKERDSFFNDKNEFLRIKRSLKSSLSRKDKNTIISASSLENINTTRDIIFSLPGLFFVDKNYFEFKENFKALLAQLQDGLLPVHSPYMRDKNHYSSADLSLWLIEIGYEYYEQTNDIDFIKNDVYESFINIAESYQKGTLNNIYVDKDDLLFCGNKDLSTSWIPLTKEGGEVLRFGKLLEINALWYNALSIIDKLGSDLGKKWKSEKFSKLAEKTKDCFLEAFLKKDENIADFCFGDEFNSDFRVNQLIPLSLSFSPLSVDMCKKVFEKIEKKLLTPYGIKAEENSKKNVVNGIVNRKTSAYYNSAVWPWVTHLFVKAALRVAEDKSEKALQLKEYFLPLVQIINSGLINYIPEAISENEEIHQRGIIDYAPSLSSVLWSYFLLNNAVKEGKH